MKWLLVFLWLGFCAAGPITIELLDGEVKYGLPNRITIGLAKAMLSGKEIRSIEGHLRKWKKDYFDQRDFRHENEVLGDFINASFRQVRPSSLDGHNGKSVSYELLLGGEIYEMMRFIKLIIANDHKNRKMWLNCVLYDFPRLESLKERVESSNLRLELGDVKIRSAVEMQMIPVIMNSDAPGEPVTPPKDTLDVGEQSPTVKYSFVYGKKSENGLNEKLISSSEPKPKRKRHFCCTIS